MFFSFLKSAFSFLYYIKISFPDPFPPELCSLRGEAGSSAGSTEPCGRAAALRDRGASAGAPALFPQSYLALPMLTNANPCPCLFACAMDLHYGPYHLFSCFSSPKRHSVLLGRRQVPSAVLLATWGRSRRVLSTQHPDTTSIGPVALGVLSYWGPSTPLLTGPLLTC